MPAGSVVPDASRSKTARGGPAGGGVLELLSPGAPGTCAAEVSWKMSHFQPAFACGAAWKVTIARPAWNASFLGSQRRFARRPAGGSAYTKPRGDRASHRLVVRPHRSSQNRLHRQDFHRGRPPRTTRAEPPRVPRSGPAATCAISIAIFEREKVLAPEDSNFRQRPELDCMTGISRPFRPLGHLIVVVHGTFSGLAEIAGRRTTRLLQARRSHKLRAGRCGMRSRCRPLLSRRARYPIPPPYETVRSGYGFPVRQVQFCLKTASIGA